MRIVKPDVIELFKDLKLIVDKVPTDFGGGSPLSKTMLMVYLALEHDLQNYVEIGVYRGRSFFPMAYAAKRLGGMAYGIDAFDCETAKEYDLEATFAGKVNQFLESVDFTQIYEDVMNLQQELSFSNNSKIIKQASRNAIDYFRSNRIVIDMLHVDGNHDTKYVMEDFDLYLPLVRDGGVVVIDDIDWDSVKPAFDYLKEKYEFIFENGQFAVFLIGTSNEMITSLHKARLKILNGIIGKYELESACDSTPVPEGIEIARISVVVISYNQEKYIAECLEGIFAQKGNFTIEVIIGDDCSTDSTLSIVRGYESVFCNNRFEVKILPADKNIGMTKNLKRCFEACTGEYVAVCEGDDYWVDCYKLQKQIAFLRSHPECSFCFNDIYIYVQDSLEYTLFDLQQHLNAEVLTTRELILDHFIGNLSCCMYNAQVLKGIPDSLFDLFIGDWMLNIYCSRFGGIGHIKEAMSIYRKHNESAWAGRNPADNAVHLHTLIEEYNRYLHYDFDREFCSYQKRLEETHPDAFNNCFADITIIDDVFPHPLSAFRMEEFNSYLKEFESLKIYSSGISVHVLGDKSLDELIIDFKRTYPERSGQIKRFGPDTRIDTRLMYTVFLGNAYMNLAKIEQLMVPFVFTLYPGGMFGLNNRRSDEMLKMVTSSPCFRKVIVTQKITYDYLIEKKFCTPDQIEFIFGVVMPIEQINIGYVKRSNFGIDKNSLDIVFVSFKYTEKGIDKGYDLFVDVAKELCKKYDNIYFHVVGGFDENVIDVTELGDRITFYGSRKTEWFDEFYKDKDIILSPNIPFMIFEGSFDGFPTGTCVDAGLRKTAIFCADELHLNNQFVDREEIVIIPHDVDEVTEIVEYYYRNPEELRTIAENGCRKIKRLYSYESQILPRIKILKAELERADISRKEILKVMDRFVLRRYLSRTMIAIIKGMKKICPVFLKKLLKKMLKMVRSNERLTRFIKRICPGFLLRSYYKIRASL